MSSEFPMEIVRAVGVGPGSSSMSAYCNGLLSFAPEGFKAYTVHRQDQLTCAVSYSDCAVDPYSKLTDR
ncbi:hypothetical protein SNOG_12164 [Parastagonospora nodorum SN15]|uniref:Uncharacterized protein n=1 Tax=Phaeosphaeria nodorum (strain SN15 / ATCC MYA-4574 / FGSC 10173) TaxID=321614 RepID=Q0U7V0_PHANO|nr:hypothetical protein SNOG_12164 [Parastagonospora nodorum SN15]EAT80576.1 hypothetical protein SNOG_12164 [Parastagonospora nodorum SN15]